jgi:hypothetical protein
MPNKASGLVSKDDLPAPGEELHGQRSRERLARMNEAFRKALAGEQPARPTGKSGAERTAAWRSRQRQRDP